MTVTCGTKAEVNAWLEALKNHIVPNPSSSSKPVSLQVSMVNLCRGFILPWLYLLPNNPLCLNYI